MVATQSSQVGSEGPLQVSGRLDGDDAAFVRAMMENSGGGRCSVMDAVRRLIAVARVHGVATAAAEAQVAVLRDQLEAQAQSLNGLMTSYAALAASFAALTADDGGLIAHVQAMERAQWATANASKTMAAESAVIRGAAVDALKQVAPQLGALNHLVDYLNSLLDALNVSGDARAIRIATGTVLADRQSESGAG